MPDHPRRSKSQPGAEARILPRWVVCAVAVCVAAFIFLEPLMFDTPPGLQIFQALLVTGLCALLMFGGTSDPPAGRKWGRDSGT